MTKEQFIILMNSICNAEKKVIEIENETAINIQDLDAHSDLYCVIFKLFEVIYGYEGSQLIESYLFDDVLYTGILSHEELYEKLQKL